MHLLLLNSFNRKPKGRQENLEMSLVNDCPAQILPNLARKEIKFNLNILYSLRVRIKEYIFEHSMELYYL